MHPIFLGRARPLTTRGERPGRGSSELMNHFSIWEWADFVRGLVDEGARSVMDTHLSSGCRPCARVVNVLRGVSMLARSEADYEPADYAIQYAQAIYALGRPEAVTFPRLVARLVHDSMRAPLPAGMRGEGRASRHALYEAGSYCLDLQLERQPNSGLITLVGQFADRDNAPTSMANVPVWLIERKALIASALCNGFGEFHLEFAPARNLRLRVPIPRARRRLEISLNALDPGLPDSPRPARVSRRPIRRRRRGR